MPAKNNKSSKVSRREFLKLSGCTLGVGMAYLLFRFDSGLKGVLPPGAELESEFLAACIRCGRCAAVCPQNAIRMGVDGYPYIDGLGGWCDFCLNCVEECPTEALKPVDPDTAVIGLAEIDRERCIPWNWPGCRLCYFECLELQSAVYLDDQRRPHINDTLCNGCGACVTKCPVSAVAGKNRKYGKVVSLLQV